MGTEKEDNALADLDEIFAYIAEDNRQTAARIVTRIGQATARIAVRRDLASDEEVEAIFSRYHNA